jgi:hypothetical protein
VENRPCPLCRLAARWGDCGPARDIACPHCADFAISSEALGLIGRSDFPGYQRLRLMELSRAVHTSGARLRIDLEVVRGLGRERP